MPLTRPGGELILVTGRDPLVAVGGGESYVQATALAAQELGYHPHIFSVSNRSEVRETPFGTLHLVWTPIHEAAHTRLALLVPVLQRAVVRFLRDKPGHHVVHGFNFWADLNPGVRRSLWESGVEVDLLTSAWTVVADETPAKLSSGIVRSSWRLRAAGTAALWWNLLATRHTERQVARNSRLLLVNYDSVREMLQQAYGPGLPIRRISYMARTAFDDAPGSGTAPPEELTGLLAHQAPLIVSMSRHDGRKGVDVLILALGLLRDRGVPFVALIGGHGVLLAGHRKLVADLDLSDQVMVPGPVPDVMPYLRACDVFVLPSVSESSGSVAVLEALQAGAPVVSTNVDGMPEDLTDGRNALLVPPSDPVALSAAIERLIDDGELRARLGVAGRKLFEDRFSRAVAVAELGAVYSELGLRRTRTRASQPADGIGDAGDIVRGDGRS
jgi:glycosyltransferase involved in cell wall biosynthesis